jgi:hypothetical protein
MGCCPRVPLVTGFNNFVAKTERCGNSVLPPTVREGLPPHVPASSLVACSALRHALFSIASEALAPLNSP